MAINLRHALTVRYFSGFIQKYGTRCLKYLRGEFAFVLYDAKISSYFAARDYFGIKPLFYVVDNQAITLPQKLKL